MDSITRDDLWIRTVNPPLALAHLRELVLSLSHSISKLKATAGWLYNLSREISFNSGNTLQRVQVGLAQSSSSPFPREAPGIFNSHLVTNFLHTLVNDQH